MACIICWNWFWYWDQEYRSCRDPGPRSPSPGPRRVQLFIINPQVSAVRIPKTNVEFILHEQWLCESVQVILLTQYMCYNLNHIHKLNHHQDDNQRRKYKHGISRFAQVSRPQKYVKFTITISQTKEPTKALQSQNIKILDPTMNATHDLGQYLEDVVGLPLTG